MARDPPSLAAGVSSADMEPWERTFIRIIILLHHNNELEHVYASRDIPPAEIGFIKTPRDVLNYLETFASYRALLAPDYFVTFPEPFPMMWPVFRDRPLSEAQSWYELDDQLWDRTVVEEFLADTESPQDRIGFLFFVISEETMNAEAIEAIMAEVARIERYFESVDAAEEQTL